MKNVETRVSTDGLTRCTKCRRHVQAGETPSTTVCPFCSRMTPSSRRGALLAASLFAMACGGAEPAPEQSTPQTTETQTTTETAEAPADPVETPEPEPEVATPEPEPEPEEEDSFDPEPAAPMAPMARYGRVPTRK